MCVCECVCMHVCACACVCVRVCVSVLRVCYTLPLVARDSINASEAVKLTIYWLAQLICC